MRPARRPRLDDFYGDRLQPGVLERLGQTLDGRSVRSTQTSPDVSHVRVLRVWRGYFNRSSLAHTATCERDLNPSLLRMRLMWTSAVPSVITNASAI